MKKLSFFYYVGIDISKLWFDAYILDKNTPKQGEHHQFSNNKKGFHAFIQWLKETGVEDLSKVLIGMEHTGVYTVPLCEYLNTTILTYTLIPGLTIKKSLGITRGKNDKIDAKRIARYIYKEIDFMSIHTLPSKAIRSIQSLLAHRRRLQKAKHAFGVSSGERKAYDDIDNLNFLTEASDKMVDFVGEQLKEIDSAINQILHEYPELKRNYDLMCSVPGIGRWTALNLIVCTQNFVRFSNSRKFASYAGIAPFDNSSGKKVAKSAHVSHIANKNIKALLTNGAYSAVRSYQEFKEYFDKQIEKGKNEFCVINNVKNKMIHRVFAVIRRQQEYVNVHAFANTNNHS